MTKDTATRQGSQHVEVWWNPCGKRGNARWIETDSVWRQSDSQSGASKVHTIPCKKFVQGILDYLDLIHEESYLRPLLSPKKFSLFKWHEKGKNTQILTISQWSGSSPTYHCKTTVFTLCKLFWHFLS